MERQRSCYNCTKFPNCPKVNSMLVGDLMDTTILDEYGQYCGDHVSIVP